MRLFVAALLALVPFAPAVRAQEEADSLDAIHREVRKAHEEKALGIDSCLSWIERCEAIAAAAEEAEDAFQARLAALRIAGMRKSREIEAAREGVLERLLERHVDEPARMDTLLGAAGSDALRERVAARTQNDAVVAVCRFRELEGRIEQGIGGELSDDERNELLDELKGLRARLAAAAGAQSPAERIDGELFRLERLRIGAIAPDIEGTDLDGVAFKLSDYRGKVVVLDFWGNW